MDLVKNLLLLLYFVMQAANTQTEVEIKNMVSHFNPQVCSHSFCMLTNTRGKMKYINFGCNFRKPVQYPMLTIQLLRAVNPNHFVSTTIRVEQNLCNFTDFNSDNYFINRMLSFSGTCVRAVKCPFQGNVTVTKFPVMLLHVADVLLPPATYLLNAFVRHKELELVNLNITFSVTPKKAFMGN